MKQRLRFALAAACVFALAAALGGATWAAFSSETDNQGNTVATAATFANMPLATGSYTGDGLDNRPIALPFAADVLIVKSSATGAAAIRTSTMTGDATKPMTGAAGLTANLVQSMTTTAFTLGTDTRVNANGVVYQWTAFKAAPINLQVGSYTGDGSASRQIPGAGYAPEYTMVLSAGTGAAHQRMTGMTASFPFDAGTGIANGITGTHPDGFTVSNNAAVNAAGTAYHWIGWDERAGGVDIGTHAGDGTTGANVTGVGFSPQYAILRANDTSVARQGHHRPLSLTGTASQFFGATADSPSAGIRAFTTDGFSLGNDASVNATGVTYHRAAFRHTGNDCTAPGAATVAASADAWVNEAAPTTNSGTASTMNVLSRTANRNGRAYVTFALPALPAGCSVTDVRLRLYDRTPVGGRTLLATRNATTFAETTVNWNNQPAVTGPAASAVTPAAARWMEWDVTAQAGAMYPPGTNTGFQIRDETESGSSGGFQQVFDSRTGTAANRPQLVVTYG